MAIKKLVATNFKSFTMLELDLHRFNVFIGANASGKSNLVSIFRFLHDLSAFGLDDAISMQGGIEYLRNRTNDQANNIEIDIISDRPFGLEIDKNRHLYSEEIKYGLTIGYTKSGKYRIERDEVEMSCKVISHDAKTDKDSMRELGGGSIRASIEKKRIQYSMRFPDELRLQEDLFFPPFLKNITIDKDTILPNLTTFASFPIERIFNGIGLYDFDPKLPKRAFQVSGKTELEEDGGNLVIALKGILDDKAKKAQLSNLIRDLLPFADDIDVEKFAGKSMLFKMKEKWLGNTYLPASLISDGTVNLVSLLIALYFEKTMMKVVEEPERNIHPGLLSKVVEMMKDAAEHSTVITTTHNPEIVKYAGIENIYLVTRGKNGCSNVGRPSDNKEIKKFLKQDIGMDELFINNLLI